MNPSTITHTSFLHIIPRGGDKARQIITVLSVGKVSAVCVVETVHPNGTISQDRLTNIMRTAIPPRTLRAVHYNQSLGLL